MTAQFAPVAPIQILEEMSFTLLGNYHLFLAHHTAEHPERFHQLVSGYSQNRPYSEPMRIIMDNSIVELGGAVDDKMIYAATAACSHNKDAKVAVVPCLPDVMGEGPATRQLSIDAYKRWDEMGMDRLSGSGYMLVTQGETQEDFINLVNYFFVEHAGKFPHITWVGIPRYMLNQWAISRKWAIRYIQMVAPHVKIHLLGFSWNITSDLFDAREPGVMGIDSAVPVRYEELLTPQTTDAEIGKRKPDWMENGKLTNFGIRNIQNVRRWINTSQIR